VKIEIVCADAGLQQIVETILRTAQTGEIGDGKVFISELKDAVRIRTGETGDEAV
jgi:nitrogen regulatory protein P-II 1